MTVGNPVIVGKNYVVRLRTGVDRRKTEGMRRGPLEGPIQPAAEMLPQNALGIIAAGHDLDFGPAVGFMPKRLPVRREVGDSQAVAAKRGLDGLGQVARSQRSGDLVGMDGVVRMEAAPLQHHFLERIETSAGGRRLASHCFPH